MIIMHGMYNIKLMGWIELAQDRYVLCALVNAVISLQVP